MLDPTIVFDHPEAVVVLAVVIRGVVAYQREVSWAEYRTVHAGKRALFPLLQTLTPGGFSFVNDKGLPADDAEHVTTVQASRRAVVAQLRRGGAELHLLSSIKRRPDDSYSTAHVRWTHEDGRQTEAYLFDALDEPGVDLYAHAETAVEDPQGHIEDTQQVDGDPRGVVTAALSN